ncbi:ribonuclease T [Buchnera aphidicola]|uniref:ribonuclease T n=1 Tax=Buchnera aphidicola TaxID=9 RepID=UPI00346414C6
MNIQKKYNLLKNRFRNFYPVVIDIETTGFDHKMNALLEIAVITLKMNQQGWLENLRTIHFHIKPFLGAIIEKQSMILHKINLFSSLRQAVDEEYALKCIFDIVSQDMQYHQCKKSIIVAHNATFDHNFLMEAAKRCKITNNPFHPFVTFDTATLSGLAVGQTVLSKACQYFKIPFDNHQAHSALYDTIKTAKLFCKLINQWKKLGGWPPKKYFNY